MVNIVTFEHVSKAYRMGDVDVAALSRVSLRIPAGIYQDAAGVAARNALAGSFRSSHHP
jgi:hypothetical protein